MLLFEATYMEIFLMNRLSFFYKSIVTAFFCVHFLWAMPVLSLTNKVETERLIDRVVLAYGGEKLSALKSLKVSDRYKVFSVDQGADPDMNAVSTLHSTLTVDFSSGKKSVKNWSQSANGNQLNQILYDGKSGWSINHLRGTHVENKNLNSDTVGAGMMRMIDTALALHLKEQRNTAKIISFRTYVGAPIYTLSFVAKNKKTYFLDVDLSSGFILRMYLTESPIEGTVYEFRKHTKIEGLIFASEMNMLVKGKPRFITISRTIVVNSASKQDFAIPKQSTQLKGMIDRTEMSVQKLANHVYLAGEGGRFSIFVDAGDYFIGGGGSQGLKKRLLAVNRYLGTNKLIKVQVIPDHHRGHLGAIKELEEMGSHIVIASQHRRIIESLRLNHRSDDIRVLDNKMDLEKGLIEIYDINTVHAENYLLFYVPSAKLVFSADHFGTNLIDALPGANNTVKTFESEISRLGIEVESFAHAHGPRVLSSEDLKKVLFGYKVKPCPPGHDICMD
jgi:hypothetical protein